MLASDYMENLKASGNNISLIAVCLCGKVWLDFLKNEDRFGLKKECSIQKRQSIVLCIQYVSVHIKKALDWKKKTCLFKTCR